MIVTIRPIILLIQWIKSNWNVPAGTHNPHPEYTVSNRLCQEEPVWREFDPSSSLLVFFFFCVCDVCFKIETKQNESRQHFNYPSWETGGRQIEKSTSPPSTRLPPKIVSFPPIAPPQKNHPSFNPNHKNEKSDLIDSSRDNFFVIFSFSTC